MANTFIPIMSLPVLPSDPGVDMWLPIQAGGSTYRVEARKFPLVTDALITWINQQASMPFSRELAAGPGMSIDLTDPTKVILSSFLSGGIVVDITGGTGIDVNSANPAHPVVSLNSAAVAGIAAAATAVQSVIGTVNQIDVNIGTPTSPVLTLAAPVLAALALAGTALQPGSAIASVSAGFGITIDNTNPSIPVVAVNQAMTPTWTGTHTFSPAAGLAINVTGAAVGPSANFNAPSGIASFIRFQTGGVSIGDVGDGAALFSGGAGFGITSRNTQFNIGTNSIVRVVIGTAGNIFVAAAVAAETLTVNGAANQNTLNVTGNLAAGQSFGALVLAGTSAADYALSVRDRANNQIAQFRGDRSWAIGNNGTTASLAGNLGGNILIGAPSAGNSLTIAALGTNGLTPGIIVNAPVGGIAGISLVANGGSATATDFLVFQNADGSGYLNTRSGPILGLQTGGATRLQIDMNGQVAINQPAAGVGLTVVSLDGGVGLALSVPTSTAAAQIKWNINGGNVPGRLLSALAYQTSAFAQNWCEVKAGAFDDSCVINFKGVSGVSVQANGQELGFRNLGLRSLNANTAVQASDAGRAIVLGLPANSLTLPTGMPVGTLVTFLSVDAVITVSAAAILSWYNAAGIPPNGPRTVAAGGVVTLWCSDGTNWAIWGTGIS
jgi:hypothetical protein